MKKPRDFILGWATFLSIEEAISVFHELFQNRRISILLKLTPHISFYLCTGIHFLQLLNACRPIILFQMFQFEGCRQALVQEIGTAPDITENECINSKFLKNLKDSFSIILRGVVFKCQIQLQYRWNIIVDYYCCDGRRVGLCFSI